MFHWFSLLWFGFGQVAKALIERTCLVTLMKETKRSNRELDSRWVISVTHTNLFRCGHIQVRVNSHIDLISTGAFTVHMGSFVVWFWTDSSNTSPHAWTILEIKRLYEYMILIIYVSILCLFSHSWVHALHPISNFIWFVDAVITLLTLSYVLLYWAKSSNWLQVHASVALRELEFAENEEFHVLIGGSSWCFG